MGYGFNSFDTFMIDGIEYTVSIGNDDSFNNIMIYTDITHYGLCNKEMNSILLDPMYDVAKHSYLNKILNDKIRKEKVRLIKELLE